MENKQEWLRERKNYLGGSDFVLLNKELKNYINKEILK